MADVSHIITGAVPVGLRIPEAVFMGTERLPLSDFREHIPQDQ